jgi:hypothetical protein
VGAILPKSALEAPMNSGVTTPEARNPKVVINPIKKSFINPLSDL